MSVASAIHAAAAVLLVVAGAAKLSMPASGAADLLGFRAPARLIRLAGGSEMAVGVAALAVGGPFAWAVGLVYASFAAIILRAVRAGARSCGCFGRLEAPPSLIHLGGNLALAAASFAAAGAGRAPVAAVVQEIGSRPAVGLALAVEIVVVAGLSLVGFTALPEALGAPSGRGAGTLFRAVAPPAARSADLAGSEGRSPRSADLAGSEGRR